MTLPRPTSEQWHLNGGAVKPGWSRPQGEVTQCRKTVEPICWRWFQTGAETAARIGCGRPAVSFAETHPCLSKRRDRGHPSLWSAEIGFWISQSEAECSK